MNIKDERINYDNHHDESKTRTDRFSKLPNDGDPCAPNNLLKPRTKEKHQLNPGGPSNRQEAPVPSKNKYIFKYFLIKVSFLQL